MQKNAMFHWFVRGFTITLLVMVVVLVAAKGPTVLAQTTGPNNEGDVIGSSANVDVVNPSNDLDLGDSPTNGLTDDPLGRTLIPLPGDQSKNPNVDAGSFGDGIVITSEAELNAIEGSIEDYISPLVIPAADFRDDGWDPIGSMYFLFAEGSLQNDSNTTLSCVMAPAYLPHGVTIDQLITTYKDNDADSNARMILYRLNHTTGVVDEMASVATTGSSDSYIYPTDLTIEFPDTAWNWAYYLGGCGASDSILFYAAQIWYFTP